MSFGCDPEITLVTACPDDLEALCALEKSSFARPWSKKLLADELARPLSLVRLARPVSGPAAAWLCARVLPPEAELLRIAVAPAHRRRGLAGRLLAELEAELVGRRIETLHLEVAATNRAAINLYRTFGFVPTGRRSGYYDRGRTAALLLKKDLS